MIFRTGTVYKQVILEYTYQYQNVQNPASYLLIKS
jgi:hypothetical protein